VRPSPASGDPEEDSGDGDLYHDPEPGAESTAPERPSEIKGSWPRAVVYGLVAAALSATGWYNLAAWSGFALGILALVVGGAVAYGVAVGADRKGADVAVLSLLIFVVAFLVTDFQIKRHLQREALREERALAEIELDGDYTDEEAAALRGMSLIQWQRTPANAQDLLRAELADQTEELRAWQEDLKTDLQDLGGLQYFRTLPTLLGFQGLFFFAVGGWIAYKIPLD
jgi:predicted secreted protein